MFFNQDRNQIRQFFRSSWKKYSDGSPTEPLEALIGEIVAQHPEYHALLSDEQTELDRDYLPEQGEANPFLHMGMHITLREQVNTDRPAGIRSKYHELLIKLGDPHEVEHVMMDCLAESLWQAQRSGQMPDESSYLDCVQIKINHI